jgi:hypothetical protein
MTGREWNEKRSEMFQPGAVILCVENTYIPDRNGTTRTITRAGTTVCDATYEGKPYRMEMPKRVSEIELLDDGSVRYPIGRDDHKVTLRRVA